jgi:hypothetical protein
MATLFAPQFGARFQLDRLSVDDAAACYSVRIYLPEVQHQYGLRISVHTGDCVVSEEGSLPPAAPDPDSWVSKHLVALGRQLYRSAKKDGMWQRRVMRWHGAPDSTTSRDAERIAS